MCSNVIVTAVRFLNCVVFLVLILLTYVRSPQLCNESCVHKVSHALSCNVAMILAYIRSPWSYINLVSSTKCHVISVVMQEFYIFQGTHKSLKDNQKAKATVGAIIDGMGSLGAAFGPLVTGWVSDFFVCLLNMWLV